VIDENASLFPPERYVYQQDAPYFPEPWEGESESEEQEEEFDAVIDAAVDELFASIKRRKDSRMIQEDVKGL
jgi:hypothetical protein